MNVSAKNYDICLLLLGDPATDARALNLAETFRKNGFQTALVAEYHGTSDFMHPGIDFHPVAKSKARHLRGKWIDFNRNVQKLMNTISAGVFIAMDLYSLLPARKLARYKARLIYDSREIYSALGPLHSSPVKQALLTQIEKYLIRRVDHFIVSGSLDAVYLKKHFSTDKPFSVVMNVPYFRKKIESDVLRRKFDIPDNKLIALYQGMVLHGRGLRTSISAISLLDNIFLVILGTGEFLDDIKKHTKKKNAVDKVVFGGKVPYGRLHEYTCSADIGLSIIRPVSFSYEMALPNKLFEYCAAGIPVISTDLPAIRTVYDRFNIGEIISKDAGPKELAEALIKLSPLHIRDEVSERCLTAAKEYCYEAQEEVIISLAQV